MKKIISSLLLVCTVAACLSAKNVKFAKPVKTVFLYPEGQQVDKGIVENGVAVTLGPGDDNGLRGEVELSGKANIGNINEPYMDIYIPKKCNGQMIVCCPGGGYKYCSSKNEGTYVADWCDRHNVAVCVVLYRMPNHHSTVPLTDVQNAFRYCRAHAEEWGIKQIGVMGFSAGGHLAASATTLFVDEVTRPDFSILVYPVITMEKGVTHQGTCSNLTGNDPELKKYYSLENQVRVDQPQTILILCQDDKAVPAENSIRFYRKMIEKGVKGELHIFTEGGHGWGFTTPPYDVVDHLGLNRRAEFFSIIERWLGQCREEIQ